MLSTELNPLSSSITPMSTPGRSAFSMRPPRQCVWLSPLAIGYPLIVTGSMWETVCMVMYPSKRLVPFFLFPPLCSGFFTSYRSRRISSTPALTSPPSLPDSFRTGMVDSRMSREVTSMSSGGCAPSSCRSRCPVMARIPWRAIVRMAVATNWFWLHIASAVFSRSSGPYRALGADDVMWVMCGSRVRRVRL